MTDLDGLRASAERAITDVGRGVETASHTGKDVKASFETQGRAASDAITAWENIDAPVNKDTPEEREPTTAECSARVLRAAQMTVGAVTGALGSLKSALDVGFADLTAPLAAIAPSMPAATLGSLYLGTPHAHPAHPPSGPPPVPPTPCPSMGAVLLGVTPRVLINSLPAARCDDIGLAPTCMGIPPAWFRIKTGSSNVFLSGSRAARFSDICIACKNIPDPPSIPAGKVMAAIGKAADVASRGLQAAGIAAGVLGAAANAAEAAVEDDAAMAQAKALAAAMEAAQLAMDMAKAAVEATMWKDPTLPPTGSIGAIIDPSHANVLIGGFPMINIPDPVSALLNRLKRYKAPSRPGSEDDGAGPGSCPG